MTGKTKIYLDTSVISCLQALETPERMADSLRLWEDLKAGIYDVYISDITIDDIHKIREWHYHQRKEMGTEEYAKKLSQKVKSILNELLQYQ